MIHTQDDKQPVVHIAAFDFDGTIIDGQSGAQLVVYMLRRKLVPLTTLLRVMWWGVRYKLRLPHEQSEVRESIFKLFTGDSVHEVDLFLAQFHDDALVPLYRKDAVRALAQAKRDGMYTIIVSASFDAILRPAKELLGADAILATHMERTLDELGYTGQVLGEPVEGAEKVEVIREFANEQFGEGNWVIDRAFGDHHSDRYLLRAARSGHAVGPDHKLRRIAKKSGWPVLEWR